MRLLPFLLGLPLTAGALAHELPPSVPTQGLATVDKEDGFVAEDYGRGMFRLTANAENETEKLGRHWFVRLHPPQESAEWNGFAVWKALRQRLVQQGWKPVYEEVGDAVNVELTRKGKQGEEWVRVFLHASDPGANKLELVEVAPVPLRLDLKPPAPGGEKVADGQDFPFFTPFAGTKLQDTTHDDSPMEVQLDEEPRVVAPGSVVKSYQGMNELSNLEFVTVYRDALQRAGWSVLKVIEGPEASDTEIIARYMKGGRDVWAFVHQTWEGWSVRVGDAGAGALAAALARECKVNVYGVNFDFNKATLRPDADAVLTQLFQLFQADPQLKAEVSGHTDDVGGRAYNEKLSKARAEAVKAWLVKKGIGAERLTTQGYADTQPVVPNDSDENRAKNRRVQVAKAGCRGK